MSERDERSGRVAEQEREEPFLARWARLKRESHQPSPGSGGRTRAKRLPAPPTADGQAADGNEQASPPSEAAQATAEANAPPQELPPLESLTAESDFRAFMQPGVDDALRRTALRKMWQNPVYGVVDELDPFRADFAAFTPLGDIVTSDMKFHAERLLREQLEKAAESAESAGDGPGARKQGLPGLAKPAKFGRATRRMPPPAVPEAGGGPDTQDESNLPTEDADERRDT
jgi:hypothetical protein